MARIPYDIVAIEANRYIVRMVTASTMELAIEYWDQYLNYIETCGWTDWEYDLETIKRVDAAWELMRRRVWN